MVITRVGLWVKGAPSHEVLQRLVTALDRRFASVTFEAWRHTDLDVSLFVAELMDELEAEVDFGHRWAQAASRELGLVTCGLSVVESDWQAQLFDGGALKWQSMGGARKVGRAAFEHLTGTSRPGVSSLLEPGEADWQAVGTLTQVRRSSPRAQPRSEPVAVPSLRLDGDTLFLPSELLLAHVRDFPEARVVTVRSGPRAEEWAGIAKSLLVACPPFVERIELDLGDARVAFERRSGRFRRLLVMGNVFELREGVQRLASSLDTVVLEEERGTWRHTIEELGLMVEVGSTARRTASVTPRTDAGDAATVLSWLDDD